jgi:hypothetical protein
MKKILALLLTLFSLNSFSQAPNIDWANHYDGTAHVHSMIEDVNNNLLIVGIFEGTIDFDPGVGVFNLTSEFDPLYPYKNGSMFIQKLNQQGGLIWVKKIDLKTPGNTEGCAITSDNTGAIYISTQYEDTVDFDPGNGVYNVSAVTDSSNNALFVCKLLTNGDFSWVKTAKMQGQFYWGKPELVCDNQNKITLISPYYYGNIDVTFGQGINIINILGNKFLIKMDNNGNYIHSKIIPISPISSNVEEQTYIDNTGNLFCAGSITNSVNISMTTVNTTVSPLSSTDGIFIKYDANYQLQWYKVLNSYNNSYCKINNIVTASDGSVIITGLFDGIIDIDPSPLINNITSQSGETFFVAKYSSNGTFIWAKQFEIGQLNGFGFEKLKVLQNNQIILAFSAENEPNTSIDVDPGVGVINYTSSSNDSFGVLLILDNNGNYVWSQKYSSIGDEVGILDLYVSAQNEIYFSGRFSGTVNFSPTNLTVPVSYYGGTGQIDLEGFLVKYNLGNTNSIDELNDDKIVLYPNPTNGKLSLKFNEKFKPELVTVKNINSQIIESYSISKNTSNEFEIELNAVNGIYFIEVFDGENTITKKVIKN